VLFAHQQIEQAQDNDADAAAESHDPEAAHEIVIDAVTRHKVAQHAANHEEHHRLKTEEEAARPFRILVVRTMVVMVVRTVRTVNVFMAVRALVGMDMLLLVLMRMTVAAFTGVHVFMFVTV
jgi:hypothetical protein